MPPPHAPRSAQAAYLSLSKGAKSDAAAVAAYKKRCFELLGEDECFTARFVPGTKTG